MSITPILLGYSKNFPHIEYREDDQLVGTCLSITSPISFYLLFVQKKGGKREIKRSVLQYLQLQLQFEKSGKDAAVYKLQL
jgi:hypothetical protein